MKRKTKGKGKKTFGLTLLFLLVAGAVFIGVQYFTKTGIFKEPGIITYDESVTPEEQEFLSQYFTAEDLWIEHDATISAKSELAPIVDSSALLYDVLVPVADFYQGASTAVSTDENLKLVSINELKPNQKLLTLDGKYYLDEFNAGAFFRYFYFECEDPTDTQAIDLIRPHLNTFPTAENTLSFAQTGVTALSRAMLTKLNRVGGDGSYFAANIAPFLSKKDITHISNESSFTNRASSSNICSDWRMLGAITAIGTDIVELTGNHNNDCGRQANLDSIAKYKELNMKIVGGGANANEAAVPLKIEQEGAKITLLAYNQSTGGATTGNYAGANQYYENTAAANIKEAKDRGDFVIVDIQYYECYCYPDGFVEMPACDKSTWGYNQQGFFRHLIDLGADIVVGVSAHQPQTFELYGNGAIYYGLGNLFFDQTYWPGTERGLILTHYFIDGKHVQTRISPTVFDGNLQVSLMNEESSTWLLNRLANAR